MKLPRYLLTVFLFFVFFSAAHSDSPTGEWTKDRLEKLRRKIGQMIIIHIVDFHPTARDQWLLSHGYVGGVVLYTWNIQSQDQVTQLVQEIQKDSLIPPFIAVDQEGGSVSRLNKRAGFHTTPSEENIGKTGDPQKAYQAGLQDGADMKAIGANLNFAPVVDVDHGYLDPAVNKFHRTFSKDPQVVAQMGMAFMKGLQDQGIIATAKHFPSQTWVTEDTHFKVVHSDVSADRIEKEDLVPYKALIGGGLDAIMLSHVIYTQLDPTLPASLSPKVVHDLLREKLGFKGLIISDSFNMKTVQASDSTANRALDSVKAGVDVMLIDDGFQTQALDNILNAVVAGHLSEDVIDQAYRRILGIKAKYHILPAGWAEPGL